MTGVRPRLVRPAAVVLLVGGLLSITGCATVLGLDDGIPTGDASSGGASSDVKAPDAAAGGDGRADARDAATGETGVVDGSSDAGAVPEVDAGQETDADSGEDADGPIDASVDATDGGPPDASVDASDGGPPEASCGTGSCTIGSECCTGACGFTSSGNPGTCVTSCLAKGKSCTGNSQCCYPTSGSGGCSGLLFISTCQ